MEFLKKLFGFGQKGSVEREVQFSRGPKSVNAIPGKEYETFLKEVATVVGCKPEEIDLNRQLQSGYGCDELDVVECIQIAEDVWNVSIVPNALYAQDASRIVQHYTTLNTIITDARRKTAT
jgi:hypothetical protein